VAHRRLVLRRSKLLLTGLTGIFALAAVYTTVLVFNYASALRQSSPYNFAWAASQAVGEFARLEERVAAYGLAGSGTPLDIARILFGVDQRELEMQPILPRDLPRHGSNKLEMRLSARAAAGTDNQGNPACNRGLQHEPQIAADGDR